MQLIKLFNSLTSLLNSDKITIVVLILIFVIVLNLLIINMRLMFTNFINDFKRTLTDADKKLSKLNEQQQQFLLTLSQIDNNVQQGPLIHQKVDTLQADFKTFSSRISSVLDSLMTLAVTTSSNRFFNQKPVDDYVLSDKILDLILKQQLPNNPTITNIESCKQGNDNANKKT